MDSQPEERKRRKERREARRRNDYALCNGATLFSLNDNMIQVVFFLVNHLSSLSEDSLSILSFTLIFNNLEF